MAFRTNRTVAKAMSLTLAILLLCSCGQDSQFSNILSRTFHKTKVETPTVANGAEMLEAFNVAFHAPQPVVLDFLMPNETTESDAEILSFSPLNQSLQSDYKLSFAPAAFIQISNELVALVSNGSGEQTGCNFHACQGKMTIHYLKKDVDKFSLLGNWEIASGAADYGETSPWKIRDDIDQNPVMFITRHFGGMGCNYEGGTLIAVTPVGPVEIARFTLKVSFQESGDAIHGPRDFEYSGNFKQLRKGKEFAIDYIGTKSGRATYRKDERGKFVPQESEIVTAVSEANC